MTAIGMLASLFSVFMTPNPELPSFCNFSALSDPLPRSIFNGSTNTYFVPDESGEAYREISAVDYKKNP